MRIGYVNSICILHDAISNAVREEMLWLLADGYEVRLFAFACDHPNLPVTIVNGPAEVVLDPYFQSCDLIVFHFGVYSALFDAIFAVPKNAKRVVVFHNITPKELCSDEARPLIEKSFFQIANLTLADKIICDSQTNQQVLIDANILVPSEVVPLSIAKLLVAPAFKPSFNDNVLRVAFIGRMVRSKAPLELLQAVEIMLAGNKDRSARVDMMCNTFMSDPAILASVKFGIAKLHHAFQGRIQCVLHENASDGVKAGILSNTDLFCLPTRHEGFCVPIVEAIASGCKVLSYSNSNVPWISGGLAHLVPTGDVAALCQEFSQLADELLSPIWRSDGYENYLDHASKHVMQFDGENIRRRFTAACLKKMNS